MSIAFDSHAHGQVSFFVLSSSSMWTEEKLNKLYRKNLLRLLKESGLKKGAFAEKIGIGPDYLSQLIREKKPVALGKRTILKICNAFELNPRYFDQEENEPQPLTAREERAVYKVREAEEIGKPAAEQLELMIDLTVDAMKKKRVSDGEGTKGGVLRSDHKRK